MSELAACILRPLSLHKPVRLSNRLQWQEMVGRKLIAFSGSEHDERGTHMHHAYPISAPTTKTVQQVVRVREGREKADCH